MPTAETLLRQLAAIANDLIGIAMAWHVILASVLVAIALGWRPAARPTVLALAALPVSVALSAAAYGNPFNAISFAALAVLLAIGRTTATSTAHAPAWARLLGGSLIAYAWVYPHFLVGPWTQYLYAAPLGVVPCPTLALLAGVTLVAHGFGSRFVPAVLAAWCTVYALVGIVRLGVWLDVGLAAAAVGLGVQLALGVRATRAPPRSPGATSAGAASPA